MTILGTYKQTVIKSASQLATHVDLPSSNMFITHGRRKENESGLRDNNDKLSGSATTDHHPPIEVTYAGTSIVFARN